MAQWNVGVLRAWCKVAKRIIELFEGSMLKADIEFCGHRKTIYSRNISYQKSFFT